jgi:hypothetical protein
MIMPSFKFLKNKITKTPSISLFLLFNLLCNYAFAEIDLEAMVEPIQQKTWVFVRIIEGLIMGSAGWRMLASMSLSPLVVGVIGVTVLELIKQFLK